MPKRVVRFVQRVDSDGPQCPRGGLIISSPRMRWERQRVRPDAQEIVQALFRRGAAQPQPSPAEVVEYPTTGVVLNAVLGAWALEDATSGTLHASACDPTVPSSPELARLRPRREKRRGASEGADPARRPVARERAELPLV